MTADPMASCPQHASQGSDASKLPAYAPTLAAYHRAYARELRDMLRHLPLVPGSRVLDVGCGDGAYTCWMAPDVAPDGWVMGIDLSPSYLALAQQRASKTAHAATIRFAVAHNERLPFADNSLDLVWSAQSLYSLPEPIRAVREMRRIVRPGGMVAALENDELHHILLPWSVELELAVRQAEWRLLSRTRGCAHKFYIGRRLCDVFDAAGLERYCQRTFATNRQAPLTQDERCFLAGYLQELHQYVSNELDGAMRQELDAVLNPDSGSYLLDRSDLLVTCIDNLVWGMKPQ